MTMPQMSHAFSNPDCWAGGSIDALMYFSGSSAAIAAEISHAIWSTPALDGPYLDRNRDPELQIRYEFSGFGFDGYQTLFGRIQLHDGQLATFTQSTIIDDDGLWIYAGPPIGGLPEAWDVGAYPFEDGKPTTWLCPLITQLRELAGRVHDIHPMQAATYGWLTLIDVDLVVGAVGGKIPEERWAGISIFRDNREVFYPATHLGAPIRKGV